MRGRSREAYEVAGDYILRFILSEGAPAKRTTEILALQSDIHFESGSIFFCKGRRLKLDTCLARMEKFYLNYFLLTTRSTQNIWTFGQLKTTEDNRLMTFPLNSSLNSSEFL